MAQPILITVPKYVTISSRSLAPESNEDAVARGKKRRLDHLTWEEKMQRKKLKNRVAAQTSRDRKKAKMEEMEQTLQDMHDANNELQQECDCLRGENDTLSDRNTELERRVDELTARLDKYERQQREQHNAGIAGATSQPGSAVSVHPLPKGTQNVAPTMSPVCEQPLSQSNNQSTTNAQSALWKIIALCLLYKSCSTISIPAGWKSWPKACSQIAPKNWRAILRQLETEMPRLKATHSACLNEWWGPQQSSWNPAKISLQA